MIFYLGGNQMIIKKLTVMKLHGLYDYTVRFHDDLTFLYGENGCEKRLFSILFPRSSQGSCIVFPAIGSIRSHWHTTIRRQGGPIRCTSSLRITNTFSV